MSVEKTELYKDLRVVAVRPETSTAVTITLEPAGDWSPVYHAGQFLTLVFQTPFGERRRSYSITGSSELGEPLEITVKKIDNGEFSRPLNYFTKPGELFRTTGIYGMFTLPENPGRQDYFFIAAGSGITPCYPMIKVLLHNYNCRVVLIYSNRTPADAIFYKELETLRQTFPEKFFPRFLFSSSVQLTTRRLSKWLLSLFLDEELKRPETTLCYLCGPFEFMQMCTITLLTRVKKEQIRKEDFAQHPRLVMPQPPDLAEHLVEVQLLDNLYKIPVQYPDPVTRSARKMGIALPYSCEAGRCGSCVASVTHGKFWMAYNEVLTDREIENGRVLTCQAFPVGGDAGVRYD